MTANRDLKKQEVIEVAEEFFGLVNEQNLKTTTEPIRQQFTEYEAGQFRLVVVGEIKKGKSSFINALLGVPDLLPVDVPVTTSTVYRLMYGTTERYQVFFNQSVDAETQKPPINIAREELVVYGTEDGNPENEKEVDYIAITLPNPVLQSGVIITDTPGLGGLFAEHGDITLKNAPMADAVCFVVDSVEAVVSREEVEHLKRFLELPTQIQGVSPSLFFVQTKTDAVPAEHWQQYRDRNLEIVSEHLGVNKEEFHYFPISAKLKQIADQKLDSVLLQESGFSQLRDFFETTLLRGKEERLAEKLLPPIRESVEENLLPSLAEDKVLFETESAEQLKQLRKEVNEGKKRFDNWCQNEKPKVLANFETRATDLKRKINHRLQNELDFGMDSPIIGPIMTVLKARDLDAKALESEFEAIQSRCAEECQKTYTDILGEYQEEMEGLLTQVADELGSSLKHTFTSDHPDIAKISTQTIESHVSRYARFREYAYAPMGVVIVGNMLGQVGIVGTVFPPAWPVIIAGGAIACLYYTWRDSRKNQQGQAIVRIQNVLTNSVRDMQRSALQGFDEISAQLSQHVSTFVSEIDSEINAEHARKDAAIQESFQQSSKAKSQKARDIEAKTNQAKSLISRIDTMLRSEA